MLRIELEDLIVIYSSNVGFLWKIFNHSLLKTIKGFNIKESYKQWFDW